MIQIYADRALVYDSRLEDYDLQALIVTTGLNVGGTAQITMPANHPAYESFIAYKTIVEIYRDGLLKFRGRALYPTDDDYNQRTVLCEGELCFLQDAVARPYLYQDTPAAVFTQLIQTYNSQVEPAKRFVVGNITVTDANDYIRVESETAEDVLTAINKLLERCGGYIVFTTDAATAARVINWYAELEYRSNQTIELGENLLSFSRSGANTALATAVLPYGAVDEETGERITIESVNNGLDYIVDEEARALRGFIIKPVYWDDVTVPENLKRKAEAWLAANRYIITSLTLTALDLSYVDKSFDTFQVGDLIEFIAAPYQVDEDFLLTTRTEDMLHPDSGSITLGKDKRTLTGADVAGDRANRGELHKIKHQIKADYTLGIAQAVQQSERELSSLINQTSENIKLEIADTYTTNDQVDSKVSASAELTKNSFNLDFETLEKKVDEGDAEARTKFEEIHRYIHFENGSIILGTSENSIKLTIENDMIVFTKNEEPFGWWDGVDFHTGNIVVELNERAQFGNFAWLPRTNGSLSFLKVRG